MADNAMRFVVDQGSGLDAMDAGSALAVALPTGLGSAKFQIRRTALAAIPASIYVVDQPGETCVVAGPKNMDYQGKMLGIVTTDVAVARTVTTQMLDLVPNVVGLFGAGDKLFIGYGTIGRVGSVVNVQPAQQSDSVPGGDAVHLLLHDSLVAHQRVGGD